MTDSHEGNPYIQQIVTLHTHKRELEAELSRVRALWYESMLEARDAGVTVSDISRATGVVAPNIFRILKDAAA